MEIQKKNLLREGDRFPYDQISKNCNAGKCWKTAYKKFAVEKLKKEILYIIQWRYKKKIFCGKAIALLMIKSPKTVMPASSGKPLTKNLRSKNLKKRFCLLYTSDAADDLTRVDLGGRRIIKKKKKKQ